METDLLNLIKKYFLSYKGNYFYYEKNKEYRFEIKNISNTIDISIFIFENSINLYLGRKKIHLLDDLFINNKKDFYELSYYLDCIFYSEITESLGYYKGVLKAYSFKLKNNKNSEIIQGKRNIGFMESILGLKKLQWKEKVYSPILV